MARRRTIGLSSFPVRVALVVAERGQLVDHGLRVPEDFLEPLFLVLAGCEIELLNRQVIQVG